MWQPRSEPRGLVRMEPGKHGERSAAARVASWLGAGVVLIGSVPALSGVREADSWVWLADREGECLISQDRRGNALRELEVEGPLRVEARADGGAWVVAVGSTPGSLSLQHFAAGASGKPAWRGTFSPGGPLLDVGLLPDDSLLLLATCGVGERVLWRARNRRAPEFLGRLERFDWMVPNGWRILLGGAGVSLELHELGRFAVRTRRLAAGPAGVCDAAPRGDASGGWWTLEGGGGWLVRRDWLLRQVGGRALDGEPGLMLAGCGEGVWVLGGPGTQASWMENDGSPGARYELSSVFQLVTARGLGRESLLVALPGAWILLGSRGVEWSQGGFEGVADLCAVP